MKTEESHDILNPSGLIKITINNPKEPKSLKLGSFSNHVIRSGILCLFLDYLHMDQFLARSKLEDVYAIIVA